MEIKAKLSFSFSDWWRCAIRQQKCCCW